MTTIADVGSGGFPEIDDGEAMNSVNRQFMRAKRPIGMVWRTDFEFNAAISQFAPGGKACHTISR